MRQIKIKPRIGFIGLGLMGAPMCKRLITAGYTVTVWGRSAARGKPLVKAGAALAKTPADLAARSDIVITMVTGPKDVGEVLFGKNGVVDGAHKGLTVMDMSTIGRQAAVGISKALAEYDIDFLDAPVTGSVPFAEAGTLVIMVGGEKRVFNRCEKILKVMGTPHHMGGAGMGQIIKVSQNMIGAAQLCVLGEAFALCEAYGLSPRKLVEVMPQMAIASPLIKMKLPVMAARNYKTLFSLANMTKDLKLGQLEARRAGLNLRVGKSAERVHDLAMRQGGAQKDFSVVREIPIRRKN